MTYVLPVVIIHITQPRVTAHYRERMLSADPDILELKKILIQNFENITLCFSQEFKQEPPSPTEPL